MPYILTYVYVIASVQLLSLSPPAEIHSVGGNVSPGFHRSVHNRHSSISVSSDRTSVASTLGPQGGDANPLTPQQYGVMGEYCLAVCAAQFHSMYQLKIQIVIFSQGSGYHTIGW